MGTTLTSTKRESCEQLALKHRERSPERFVVLLQRFVKILSRSVEHYENIYAELNLIKRACPAAFFNVIGQVEYAEMFCSRSAL